MTFEMILYRELQREIGMNSSKDVGSSLLGKNYEGRVNGSKDLS
jgi:hypothetical protein